MGPGRAAWALVLGSLGVEERVGLAGGCLHADHKGSIAEEEDQAHGFVPGACSTPKQCPRPVARGPEEAAGVEGRPMVEQLGRESKQAGRPEDGHPGALERCPGWERQPMTGRSVTAAGGP